MFDLDPGDELALLTETAGKLAREWLRPRLREAEAARDVADDVRAACAEIGLADLEIPETVGGVGLGARARALVNEELAAADPGAALALDPVGAALYPVLELGDRAALERLRERLAPARARAVLVWDVPTRVRVENGRARGEVPWVPADRADVVVVLDGDRAWTIERGIETTPVPGAGLRAAGAAHLRLRDAPATPLGADARGAARVRARVRLHAASLLLGAMRDACEYSRAYALERRAFGRPIAHHQALAFLITDMQMALDGARLLVHEAAWRVDRGLACGAAAAAAFAQCVEASRLVGPSGVQILGGHGFMADHPVEKAMRETRALGLLAAGFDAAVEEAGRALCDAGPPVALGEPA